MTSMYPDMPSDFQKGDIAAIMVGGEWFYPLIPIKFEPFVVTGHDDRDDPNGSIEAHYPRGFRTQVLMKDPDGVDTIYILAGPVSNIQAYRFFQ